MGLLTNLIHVHNSQIAKAVSGTFWDWVYQVSTFLDGVNPNASQATWFVDPVAGNDANSGLASATAIKTFAELARRLPPGTTILQDTVVTVASSPPSSDPLNIDWQGAPAVTVTFQGVSSVVRTNVLTAATAIVPGTQTPQDVTGPTLGLADVGSILFDITKNSYARCVKDLTGGKVRTSPFGLLAIGTNPFTIAGVAPAIGDTVQTLSLPTIFLGTVRWRHAGNAFPTTGNDYLRFDSFILEGTSFGGTILADTGYVFYSKCICQNMTFAGASGTHGIAGGGFGDFCLIFAGPQVIAQGFAAFNPAFGTLLQLQEGAYLQLGRNCIFQNAQLNVTASSLVDEFTGASFFDGTSTGIVQVFPGAIVRSIGANSLLWGTANTGFGIKVISGGGVVYQNKPTINATLGVGRETQVGGTDKQYAAIPFVEPANNAMIVANA